MLEYRPLPRVLLQSYGMVCNACTVTTHRSLLPDPSSTTSHQTKTATKEDIRTVCYYTCDNLFFVEFAYRMYILAVEGMIQSELGQENIDVWAKPRGTAVELRSSLAPFQNEVELLMEIP